MKCHFIRWNICFTFSVITRWIQKKISWRVIDEPDIALRKGAEIEVFLQVKYFVLYIFCLKSPAGQGSTKSKRLSYFYVHKPCIVELEMRFILVSFVTLIAINGLQYGAYFIKAFMLKKRWKIVTRCNMNYRINSGTCILKRLFHLRQ